MSFDFHKWVNDGKKRSASSSRYTVHPEYDMLPECIRCTITAEEHAWMTEIQRANLIVTECCPESEVD